MPLLKLFPLLCVTPALAPLASSQAFGPPQEFYPNPLSPIGIIAADIDGDGKPDMICTSDDDSTVGWCKNMTGDIFGTFQTVSTTSHKAARLAARDLNGNGNIDLAVGLGDGLGVQIYTNSGNAQFTLSAVLDVTQGITGADHTVRKIDFADFQGDGTLDVLVATASGLGWFEGDGAGGYLPPQWLQVSWQGATSRAVDLDGDGDKDVLALISWNKEIGWFENHANGTFGNFQHIADASYLSTVTTADMDGDGDNDIVAAVNSDMVWLENQGATFGTSHMIFTSHAFGAVHAADLDADGDTDVVAAFAGDTVRVLFNAGGGSFPVGSKLNDSVSGLRGVCAEDLDGDDDLEVIYASSQEGNLSWHEYIAPTGYGPEKFPLGMGYRWSGVSAVDLDGDGDQDILSGDALDKPTKWLENAGGGNFESPIHLDGSVSLSRDVYAGDLTGDGILDVVAFGYNLKTAYWYEGVGAGDFGPQQVASSLSTYPSAGSLVDFDGDGDTDILGGSVSNDEIWWIENLGSGTFSSPPTTLANFTDFSSFATGDLDHDGDQDLLIMDGSRIGFFENIGGGQVAPEVTVYLDPLGVQWSNSDVYLLDVDEDGDLDAVRRVRTPPTYDWFENLGNLQFGSKSVLTVESGVANSLLTADFDGDGDVDLLTQGHLGLNWVENLGSGTYAPPFSLALPYEATPMAVGDFDQDGLPDIAILRSGSFSLAWLENRLDTDCNGNGVFDGKDIAAGTSLDCNGNQIPDECELLIAANDIDNDGQLDDCVQPPLRADIYEMSVNAGGTAAFTLTAPNAGDIYLLLGSASGTTGGLSANGFTLPLQVDPYFNLTVTKIGSPPLGTAFGILAADGTEGTATSTFSLPPAFSPVLVGLNLHHAFLTANPVTGAVTFVSNAVPLALLP